MNRQRQAAPEPSPPPIDHHSTAQILKQSTAICTSRLFTFVMLSFLIFNFRSNVESGADYLASIVDRDPTLKSLLSRIDISGGFQFNVHRRHRRRTPLLYLSRVRTLGDDFHFGDEEYGRSLFGSKPKSQRNRTFVIRNFSSKLGFSDRIVDNGITISEIVGSGFSFKAPEDPSTSAIENQEQVENSTFFQEANDNGNEGKRVLDLRFFSRKLGLNHHEATALVFLAEVISISYGFACLWFYVTYSLVHGGVLVAAANYFLGRYTSFSESIRHGWNLGPKRLFGFQLLRWAMRDSLLQLLVFCFFGNIEDQYDFFKIFLRLKSIPFSVTSPLISGYEKESVNFWLSWFFLDNMLALFFALDPWVLTVDWRMRRGWMEVFEEGYRLLSIMSVPAINIKCLEVVVCGGFTRWILTRLSGNLFALAFQSVMEVYFMAAWLVCYLAAKHKYATAVGRTFGRRQLEDALEVYQIKRATCDSHHIWLEGQLIQTIGMTASQYIFLSYLSWPIACPMRRPS